MAAGLIGVMSLAYLAGGMGAGVLCDSLGQRPLLIAAALLAALALSGFALESSAWLWLSAPVFGIALGASITARSVAWAAAFGGPRLGRYVGMVTPGYDAGAAIVTWGGAAWLDASGGNFRALYLVAAAAALGWAVIGAVATRAPRTRWSAPGQIASQTRLEGGAERSVRSCT